MDYELKSNQDILRNDLIAEVTRYLGYAEEIHFDFISVHEKTFKVGFHSRHDEQRKPDVEYYDVCDLISQDGAWFKPDLSCIEAIVQEHFPSPNINAKFDEWVEAIRKFLVAEQPTSLRACRFSIGTTNFGLDCFDEEKEPIEEGGEWTYEDEFVEEWETIDVIPMRKAVTKTSTGYSISRYKLTKIILNYIKPENT